MSKWGQGLQYKQALLSQSVIEIIIALLLEEISLAAVASTAASSSSSSSTTTLLSSWKPVEQKNRAGSV